MRSWRSVCLTGLILVLLLSGCGLRPTIVRQTTVEPCPTVAPKPRCEPSEGEPAKPDDLLNLITEHKTLSETKEKCWEEVRNWRAEYEDCKEALAD